MTAAMTSTTLQSDVDTPKTINLPLPKDNGGYKSRHTYRAIWDVCMVLKNHCRVHVKMGKSIFVHRSDNLHMHTDILDLTMQNVSPAILMIMIIWHKVIRLTVYEFEK